MDFFDGLTGLLFYSFHRLWYPIVAATGFSNPFTLTFITLHNSFATSYLLLTTALGYLVWRKKGWALSFAISLVWTLVGLLFFGACWQRYGLTAAFSAFFTHGWLKLSAVFYWIYSMRRACLNCHVHFEDDWSSFRDWLTTLWTPPKFSYIDRRDAKKTWHLTTKVLSGLWRQKLGRDFLLVWSMILVSALIETYITPIVVLSL